MKIFKFTRNIAGLHIEVKLGIGFGLVGLLLIIVWMISLSQVATRKIERRERQKQETPLFPEPSQKKVHFVDINKKPAAQLQAGFLFY